MEKYYIPGLRKWVVSSEKGDSSGLTLGKDLLKQIVWCSQGRSEEPDLHYKLKMKSFSSEAILGAAAAATAMLPPEFGGYVRWPEQEMIPWQ